MQADLAVEHGEIYTIFYDAKAAATKTISLNIDNGPNGTPAYSASIFQFRDEPEGG